ncbi:hypothetical protein [Priestia megaterium]|uniref:hypothetical protein n=1 Tax=Priestia megaterium TaxID=1404 RepID=UPI0031FE2A7C
MAYYHGTTIQYGQSIINSQKFTTSNKFCKYGKGVYFFPDEGETEKYIKLDLREDGVLLEADVDISTFYHLNPDNFHQVLNDTNTTVNSLEAKTSTKKYMGTDWEDHFLKKGHKGLIVYGGENNIVEYVVYDPSVILNIRPKKTVKVK